MAEIIFKHKGKETLIQCNINDKMKEIIQKYISKIDNNNFFFLYNGKRINEELKFIEQANELDIKRKKMNILVYEINKTIVKENKIISKEFICPECNENILIDIKNYKINYECKNVHKRDNILLNEYEDIQKIDICKIICDKCKEKNKNNTYNNEFYYCCSCEINICPLCKSIHDLNHNIINYDDKRYICKKHNDSFIKYCIKCKENMCILCINEHNNHDIKNFENILINKNELLNEMDVFKEIIYKLKNNINEIKGKLNKIINEIEIYYRIINDIINDYKNKNRNYYILKNISEIKDSNKNIIKNLGAITNEENIKNKFNYLIDIYYQIISENKTKIYKNGEKYIGEIINGLRNGKGILYYSKNDHKERKMYEGEWKNDKREGKGIIYWNFGDRYEGEWKNDKREGKGIYYWNNGDRYEGGFKNHKRDGKGIMYYSNGYREVGDYLNDIQIGKYVLFNINDQVIQNNY